MLVDSLSYRGTSLGRLQPTKTRFGCVAQYFPPEAEAPPPRVSFDRKILRWLLATAGEGLRWTAVPIILPAALLTDRLLQNGTLVGQRQRDILMGLLPSVLQPDDMRED